jgi:hypothetical protein
VGPPLRPVERNLVRALGLVRTLGFVRALGLVKALGPVRALGLVRAGFRVVWLVFRAHGRTSWIG